MSKNSAITNYSHSLSENSSALQTTPSREDNKREILERQTKRNRLGDEGKKDLDRKLLRAVSSEDRNGLATVVELVGEGANIEAKNDLGYTALMWGASSGHAEVVKFLLKQGADIGAKDRLGYTALMLAANNGHIETVKFLLEQLADTKAKNRSGYTSVIAAARNVYTATVKFLFKQRIGIEAKDYLGNTALILAANKGHAEIVELLLKKGADIKAKSKSGYTALIAAAFEGRTKTVKLLLEQGAEIEAKTKLGNAALAITALNGHVETVKLIITSAASSKHCQMPNNLKKTIWNRVQNQISGNGVVLNSLDQEMIIFLAIILPKDVNLRIRNLRRALVHKIAELRPEDKTKIAELTALRAANLKYFTKQNKDRASSLALVNKRTYQILKINSNQSLEDWQQDKIILKLRNLRQSLIEKATDNINRTTQEKAEATEAANKVIITLLKCDNLKEISQFFIARKKAPQDVLDNILSYFTNEGPMAMEVIKEFFKEQNKLAAAEGKSKAEQQKREGENSIFATTAEIEKKDPNPNSKTSSVSRLETSQLTIIK